MAHWSEAYLSLKYDAQSFDCAHLVEKVQLEQFGRTLNLPKEHATNYREQQRQIATEKSNYADPTDKPEEGDGVLIISRGRAEHVGVYCLIQGMAYVLHNPIAYGKVCLHRIRNLPAQGMTVEGFYKWI